MLQNGALGVVQASAGRIARLLSQRKGNIGHSDLPLAYQGKRLHIGRVAQSELTVAAPLTLSSIAET